MVGDSGGGRGRRASAHRSITFRAVFGFQCCVSLSCGVLKHVPCTLLPHSYALVTTISLGTGDVRLPPGAPPSALRTALSPSGSSGSTWRLGSLRASGGRLCRRGLTSPHAGCFHMGHGIDGNPRPTPRLTGDCPGLGHWPVAVPRGTTIDQLDQCAADRTHKQIVGTAQDDRSCHLGTL